MKLMVDTELPRAARWALDELVRALSARGESVQQGAAPGVDPCLTIGLAGRSAAVDQALSASGLRCPQEPESLVLHPLSPDQLLVAGRDERGLTYALLEAVRAVELAAVEASIFDVVLPAVESPHLTWRSLQLFLCNRALEREWFYSEVFWDEYLSRLARCRYNNLSLTFGHQIAYLSPPYPFLVDLPEFPQVRPLDFTPRASPAPRNARPHRRADPPARSALHLWRLVPARPRLRRTHGRKSHRRDPIPVQRRRPGPRAGRLSGDRRRPIPHERRVGRCRGSPGRILRAAVSRHRRLPAPHSPGPARQGPGRRHHPV